ncbi:YjzD family protein [Fundicoccus ignavus]|uniref:DUF2929 family protein n=1 Tax=Fundicoccus ignavus TaxID=2664442 RepID=A0A6I2GHT4_9LACT|nr:YjzD family protein [Fundicoccus ignavus]MRI80605.1 DUF2929 family protein [Fundicoccus ignavus]MRI84839.1 DUF2929 family protein [Fundicoccus ignavus]MRJ46533.1 DUF2929 family protein [Fundicoccus ignavus]
MKYIVTLFWSFILGHVAYYLGSSLTSVSYDFTSATILGLIVAVGVVIIANMLKNSIETKSQS